MEVQLYVYDLSKASLFGGGFYYLELTRQIGNC